MSKFKLQINTSKFSYIGAESDDLEELIDIHNTWAKNEDGSGVDILQPNKKTSINVKSFTEDAEIIKIGHSYFYNRQKLLSPSSWIKQYYKEFKSDLIADKMAKAYDVKKEDILNLWETNAKVSADFGTAGHQALEMRENFKNLGSEIVEAKTKKNDKIEHLDPSLPKHPILKKIILDFEKIDKVKGKNYSEVFISDVENGMCGIIDRLTVTGYKECTIKDFKFNVEVEEKDSKHKPLPPYDGLDSNKLTKINLQLSYYAQIMENKGWKVNGLEAFVHNGRWKRYRFKKLDIK